jgi:hypothetical protein
MCKEMPVIPVNRVLGKRRTIGKNGGPRRRRGTRGRWPEKNNDRMELPVSRLPRQPRYLGSRELGINTEFRIGSCVQELITWFQIRIPPGWKVLRGDIAMLLCKINLKCTVCVFNRERRHWPNFFLQSDNNRRQNQQQMLTLRATRSCN